MLIVLETKLPYLQIVCETEWNIQYTSFVWSKGHFTIPSVSGILIKFVCFSFLYIVLSSSQFPSIFFYYFWSGYVLTRGCGLNSKRALSDNIWKYSKNPRVWTYIFWSLAKQVLVVWSKHRQLRPNRSF